MTSAYNPRVTISSPFPEADLPALFSWIQTSWSQVACDQSPQTLEAFIDWQLYRMNPIQIITWGCYLDGTLAGYLEMMPHFLGVPGVASDETQLVPAVDKIADGHGIFNRSMLGREKTTTAINLVLQEIFASGIEVMQFNLFSHNRLMIAMHQSLGGHFGGRLGAPVTQDGKPVEMELWVLTKCEWNEANAEWIQEYAAAQPKLTRANFHNYLGAEEREELFQAELNSRPDKVGALEALAAERFSDIHSE